MKNKVTLLTILLTSSTVLGGVKIAETAPKAPFSSLKLDQETYITDNNGTLNPKIILNLVPSNIVKICLPDGTVLTGIVKETMLENNQVFKVFGEITNKNNVGFGFGFTKDGIFGGAIVFRDTEETYAVKYMEETKTYILVKSLGKRLTPSSFKFKKKYLDLL